MYGPGTVNVASGEPVPFKTSVRMPGDCTVTHSERTTHLGLRGDLKLPCPLFPFRGLSDTVRSSSNCATLNVTPRLCKASTVNLSFGMIPMHMLIQHEGFPEGLECALLDCVNS